MISAHAPAVSDILFHVLLALAAVLALGHSLGALFQKLKQPPVIGEVIGGLLLGPSLLGALWPEAGEFLLPKEVAPSLGVIAQLGVILYMFQVGLELDLSHLKGKAKATAAISLLSIALPLALGAGLALWLHPRFAPPGVGLPIFSLFIGVSMAVTAFPVLARILSDNGLSRTKLGALALSCAAVDDVIAWCLLAVLVALAQARTGGLWQDGLALAAFLAMMVYGARPLLSKLAHWVDQGRMGRGVMAVVLVGVLVSSLATELIGLHAVFGAFLLGALIPSNSLLAREFEGRLKDVVAVLLLPAFFAFTGMRTHDGLLTGGEAWLGLGLILATATLGKFGGAWTAARLSGSSPAEATALGILMNTRGLVGLIVLNMGLDLGVISPQLFAMMVLMALATTMGAAPALHWFTPELLKKTKA